MGSLQDNPVNDTVPYKHDIYADYFSRCSSECKCLKYIKMFFNIIITHALRTI